MDKELILLQTQARELLAENKELKKQLSVYQNKKDSSNSHTPPSQDPHRPKNNQSLREPSGKKPGGQPGHQGKTLQCSSTADEVLDYQPDYCTCCGNDLSNVSGSLVETRQEIDIPVI